MQGREEVAVAPQCHQCCGVTVHRVLPLLHVLSREGTQVLTNVSLCRQLFNLHRIGVCEQQSLSPPPLPGTRLVPHLSRCRGGPASDKHSQHQKTHCWHICEKHVGKGTTGGPAAPGRSLAARTVSSFQKKV